MTSSEVDVLVTEYEVSILPRDDINRSAWSLNVAYRGHGLYAVIAHRCCLSSSGSWDYEVIPSEREDEWIAEHRFPLEEALQLAAEHAPNVVCNGMTAVELQEWLREHRAATGSPVGDR